MKRKRKRWPRNMTLAAKAMGWTPAQIRLFRKQFTAWMNMDLRAEIRAMQDADPYSADPYKPEGINYWVKTNA